MCTGIPDHRQFPVADHHARPRRRIATEAGQWPRRCQIAPVRRARDRSPDDVAASTRPRPRPPPPAAARPPRPAAGPGRARAAGISPSRAGPASSARPARGSRRGRSCGRRRRRGSPRSSRVAPWPRIEAEQERASWPPCRRTVGPAGSGTQLHAQVAAVRRVVDRPVPLPHRALVQPQLRQRRARRRRTAAPGPRSSAAPARSRGRTARTARSAPCSPSPSRTPPGRPCARAAPCPGRRPTPRTARSWSPPTARRPRKPGELPLTASTGPDGELRGVVDAGEVGGRRAQMDLPGGVGALQDDVLDLQLQPLDAFDAHPERLRAQPPDAPAQRPVAALVADAPRG